MPLILEEEDDRQLWLQEGIDGRLSPKLLALLRRLYEGSHVVVHRVSPFVNSVRNVPYPHHDGVVKESREQRER